MPQPTDTDNNAAGPAGSVPQPGPSGRDIAAGRTPEPLSRRTQADILILLAVFVLAFTIRVIYDLQMQASPLFEHPCLDAQLHDEWARSIVRGENMFPAPFFRGPLYPWFLAAIYKIAGPGYLLPRIIQAAIGSLSCCLMFLIGRDAFNRSTGAIAGFIAATYWVFVYFDGELLLETNSIFLNLLAMWLLMRATLSPGIHAGRNPTPSPGVHAGRHTRPMMLLTAGIVLGLSSINRPNVVAYLPFAAIWIAWLYRREMARGLRRAAIFALGCAIPILPITAYNYFGGHDLVLIAWQGGINFLIGNNPRSDGTTAQLEGIPSTWWGTYRDSVTLAERATDRDLKPSEVDDYFYSQAWQFIRTQPAQAAALLLTKIRYFWHAKELPNPTDLYFVTRRYTPMVAFLPITFAIVAPLGILGLWFDRKKTAAHFPLWGFAFLYAATVVAYFVTARFRLPVVPVLIIYAAFAAVRLAHAARRLDWPVLGGSAVAFTALWLLTHTHMPEGYFAEAPSYCAIGEAWHRAGRDEAALAEYATAIEISPEFAKARVAQGMIHWQAKSWRQAVESLERALALDPDQPIRAHLAQALAGAGRHADAIATLRQGIERNPQDASLHRGLAWLLATSPNAQDRSGAEALQIARRLVQTFPNDPIAHDTLAAAYAEAGQFLEAIQHATQAIKLADQQGNRELVQEIRKRLAEYENRQPHRQ